MLIISYDGTDYHGWQQQESVPTIYKIIKNVILKSFSIKDFLLVGASRTDTGVHAYGQVARLRISQFFEPQKILYVLNKSLPESIKIISCDSVNDQFHPQHNIEKKIYIYQFSLEKPDPCISRFVHHFRWTIDIEKLKKASSMLIGTYDFKNFCKEDNEKNTIKTIDSLDITINEQKIYTISISGKSFLRYMIRRLVGALLATASNKEISLLMLKEQLEKKIIYNKLLITAPAHGLCLKSISYHQNKV